MNAFEIHLSCCVPQSVIHFYCSVALHYMDVLEIY